MEFFHGLYQYGKTRGICLFSGIQGKLCDFFPTRNLRDQGKFAVLFLFYCVRCSPSNDKFVESRKCDSLCNVYTEKTFKKVVFN